MDGIQAYHPGHGVARPHVATVHAPWQQAGASSSSAVKAPSDYVRAVRRRAWLVLAVAVPLAVAGTLLVLRMPAIYQVTARIEVKPPRVDPAVARLVSSGDMVLGDAGADEKYVPTTMALLSTRQLLNEVVNDRSLGLPPSDDGDPAAELIGKIKWRPFPLSNVFDVTYEGRNPYLITKTLNLILDKFRKRADDDSRKASELASDRASATMTTYEGQLKVYEEELAKLVKGSNTLAPGGRNIKEAEYEAVKQRLFFQQSQVGGIRRDAQIRSMGPGGPAGNPAKAQRMADLEDKYKMAERRLTKAARIARNGSDPAVTHARADMDEARAAMAKLNAAQGPAEASPEEVAEQLMNDVIGEINTTQGRLESILVEMKDAMPEYQKFVTLMSDRDTKAKQIADLRVKLSSFAILADTQAKPVRVIDHATEPTTPIKPNRPVYIAACWFLALGLGLGLVCFLEHIDHSVKVPEHLAVGLGLPLFGVVPRMRRNALNHRGGHLWTPGAPDSVEADAYRNLRASLLGATDRQGPVVTLLVTSAKAGEGKSTTALNLAATCARAGERTLLMDVDLRRPSLDGVFPGREQAVGLVDVLRGDLPWQRTVVRTDLPNLDFLPTGDTRDVPIEVLGSLELRQLLLSLSEHHYDRVILDGPAVLGLADCRMLGRIVDAAVMVVRSGSQELRSLQRAKAMLEQSQVTIAGLVFNGLNDDLDNWSSYGPNPQADYGGFDATPRELGGRTAGTAALVAVEG